MNSTIEKTQPIGHDWPEYLELLELDSELEELKATGDFPTALGLLQAKRDSLAKSVQDELDERLGRYQEANNARAAAIKQAPTIAEYEGLIAEATEQADRLEFQIAGMDAHDRWLAEWKEIQEHDRLRQRIRAWQRAIVEHPSKQARCQPQPIPVFIEIN
jgi:hypothetical protein